MALVNVTNIVFDSQIAPFLTPLKINITFEVFQPLPDDLTWKIVYVGSPSNETFDQMLDEFSMNQLQRGVMQFTLETNPPNPSLIPTKDDLLGVTALLLQVSYNKQEFFRVGYYVYNNYIDLELIEKDPSQVIIQQVYRQIAISEPRITRFDIDWVNESPSQTMVTNQNLMFPSQVNMFEDNLQQRKQLFQ